MLLELITEPFRLPAVSTFPLEASIDRVVDTFTLPEKVVDPELTAIALLSLALIVVNDAVVPFNNGVVAEYVNVPLPIVAVPVSSSSDVIFPSATEFWITLVFAVSATKTANPEPKTCGLFGSTVTVGSSPSSPERFSRSSEKYLSVDGVLSVI